MVKSGYQSNIKEISNDFIVLQFGKEGWIILKNKDTKY